MPASHRRRHSEEFDLLIAGAGIPGIALALAAARTGARTLCVDIAPRTSRASADARTAALFPPAADFLQGIGVWPDAQPLRHIRVIDSAGRGRGRDAAIRLGGRDAGCEVLAWNIANEDLLIGLAAAAEKQPGLEVARPCSVVEMLRREDSAFARLSDGRHVAASLVAASDGAGSATRKLAGIGTRRWDHGRTALAFTARAERGGGDRCVEIHGRGRVLTLIPATEERMAVVWTLPSDEARGMLSQPPEAVAEAASRISAPHVGRLRLLAGIHPWPVRGLRANRLTARRLALVGEAAHVLPPTGAQGLNLSLGDARILGGLVGEALDGGGDPGNRIVLDAYARRRAPATALRGCLAESFVLAMRPRRAPYAPVRRLGIRAVAGSSLLRRGLARGVAGIRG